MARLGLGWGSVCLLNRQEGQEAEPRHLPCMMGLHAVVACVTREPGTRWLQGGGFLGGLARSGTPGDNLGVPLARRPRGTHFSSQFAHPVFPACPCIQARRSLSKHEWKEKAPTCSSRSLGLREGSLYLHHQSSHPKFQSRGSQPPSDRPPAGWLEIGLPQARGAHVQAGGNAVATLLSHPRPNDRPASWSRCWKTWPSTERKGRDRTVGRSQGPSAGPGPARRTLMQSPTRKRVARILPHPPRRGLMESRRLRGTRQGQGCRPKVPDVRWKRTLKIWRPNCHVLWYHCNPLRASRSCSTCCSL